MSLGGCLPMFFQMPVFYSLFMFFPIAFELRQKPFLWVEDLSSYDSIAELPFNIPFFLSSAINLKILCEKCIGAGIKSSVSVHA